MTHDATILPPAQGAFFTWRSARVALPYMTVALAHRLLAARWSRWPQHRGVGKFLAEVRCCCGVAGTAQYSRAAVVHAWSFVYEAPRCCVAPRIARQAGVLAACRAVQGALAPADRCTLDARALTPALAPALAPPAHTRCARRATAPSAPSPCPRGCCTDPWPTPRPSCASGCWAAECSLASGAGARGACTRPVACDARCAAAAHCAALLCVRVPRRRPGRSRTPPMLRCAGAAAAACLAAGS